MRPARRRGEDGSSVEVVPLEDDEPVRGPGTSTGTSTGTSSGTASHPAGRAPRPPRWRRPVVLGVVVTVVLVSGLAQLAEYRRDAQRSATFAAMVGTVPRIDGPLEATWELGPEFSAYRAVGEAIVLSRVGGRVRALDPATGEEMWALEEPVVACWPPEPGRASGPTSREPRPDTAPGHVAALACRPRLEVPPGDPPAVPRTPDELTLVLVSGETGEVLGEQRVPTSPFPPAVLGHDVVLARPRGDRIEVRRLGLADGVERWRSELPAGASLGAGGQVTVRYGLVVVETAALAAVLDADDGAVRVALRAPRAAAGASAVAGLQVQVLREGFGVRRSGVDGQAPRTVWHDPAGRRLAVVPGHPVEPAVTDGSDTGLVLAVTADQQDLVATRALDGTRLWTTPFRTGRVLVARDGALVLVRGNEIASVDLATGRDRWSRFVADVSPRSGAVTDGSTLVVVADRGRSSRFVAVDLDDGALLWDSTAPTVPNRSSDAVVHDFPWVWLGELSGRAVVLSAAGIAGLT